MKRSALAGSVVVLGFLVAASCGDSSEGTGDKGGTKPDAGEAGDGGTGTGGSAGKGGTSGASTGGKSTGGTSGSGTSGAAGGGGEATGGTAGDTGTAGAGDTGPGGEGGKATGGTGGTGGITCPAVADFPEAWAAGICTKNVDCCATDQAACRTSAEAGILQLYPGLEESVTAGRAEFNCADFIACMTAINAASCADWPKELSTDFGIPVNEPRCRSIIRGKVASGSGTNGNTCDENRNYECINGYCADPDGAGAQGLQCIAFRAGGGACILSPPATQDEVDDLCNPVTHFCNAADTNTTGQCTARWDNGGLCTAANQCESRECTATTGSSVCVKPTTCVFIPQPPSTACAIAHVGAGTGSLGWFAIAGMASLGAAGLRRRRRQ